MVSDFFPTAQRMSGMTARTPGADLRVANKWEGVGEFTDTESANHEDQLCVSHLFLGLPSEFRVAD